MKVYVANKKTRLTYMTIGITPIVIALLPIIAAIKMPTINEAISIALIASFFLLIIGFFIIAKAFNKITLLTDGLIYKNFLNINQKIQYNNIAAIALSVRVKEDLDESISVAHQSYLSNPRELKNMILMQNSIIKNLHICILIKTTKNKVIRINTTIFAEADALILEIEKISKSPYKVLEPKNVLSWQLYHNYNADNDFTKAQLPARKFKYLRFKYFFLVPICLWCLTVIYLHVWFNVTHYQFYQKVKNTKSSELFGIEFIEKASTDILATIISFESDEIILDGIDLIENDAWDDAVNVKYKYSWYPFMNPYFFVRLINLDQDPEPEIIQHNKNDKYWFHILDYNKSTNDFEVRSLDSFSESLATYINELRGHQHKQLSKLVVYTFSGILVIYLFIISLIKLLVWGNKRY